LGVTEREVDRGKGNRQEIEREQVSLRGRSSGFERKGIYFSKGQGMQKIVIAVVITSGFSKELLGKQHLSPTTENNPALMVARIETPILVTDAENGEPGWYMLTAVDDNGVFLARVSVNSDVNASGAEFEFGRGFAIPGSSHHYITKREASELIQSQFPENTVSEPMAITNLRLEDDSYSHMFLFWYFTVNDNARNAADDSDEYIIATIIPGYTSIPGGVSNRTAIDYAGERGDWHLKGYRMAKLDKPLRLFDKLETARAAGALHSPLPATTENQ
jgi:hypothetical protein